ncbi:helix-turn-helix domain-containing protein [Myxococcota bacterium]|nr:helix-turn-helix domain-containing protein [Myxococcota bacterium]MCZ7618196.1 LuxR C-terminal-related transcriptional regulator [Myxococcota bacterium]
MAFSLWSEATAGKPRVRWPPARSGRCRTLPGRLENDGGSSLAFLPATNDGDTGRPIALTALLLGLATAGAIDLALDWPNGPSPLHVLVEGTVLLLCVVGVAALWGAWARTRRSLVHTRGVIAEREAERDHWRVRTETLLRGLGAAIDDQLRAWHLTPTERETALLLLKGYGHKEIAALCGRSERTVRQHAVAVYRKSSLSGRAELAAFFLEDLLLPADPAATADADPGASGSESRPAGAAAPPSRPSPPRPGPHADGCLRCQNDE